MEEDKQLDVLNLTKELAEEKETERETNRERPTTDFWSLQEIKKKAVRKGGSIKSHLLVTLSLYIYVYMYILYTIFIYICHTSCSVIEEKLWDLWNVDLHREALEYINTQQTSNVKKKAEGGTFAEGKEWREVKSKPWLCASFPKWTQGMHTPSPGASIFFIIFIDFLPWARGSSVKMTSQALRHLNNKNPCNATQLIWISVLTNIDVNSIFIVILLFARHYIRFIGVYVHGRHFIRSFIHSFI